MQQRLVASHKFDLSKYNVLFGEVVVYSYYYTSYIFEVGFGASSLLSKHVTIEPGSAYIIKYSDVHVMIKPPRGKEISGSVSLAQCSFPTPSEYNTYKAIEVGI